MVRGVSRITPRAVLLFLALAGVLSRLDRRMPPTPVREAAPAPGARARDEREELAVGLSERGGEAEGSRLGGRPRAQQLPSQRRKLRRRRARW